MAKPKWLTEKQSKAWLEGWVKQKVNRYTNFTVCFGTFEQHPSP